MKPIIKKKLQKMFSIIGFLTLAVWMISCAGISENQISNQNSSISGSLAESGDANSESEHDSTAPGNVSALQIHYLDVEQGDATLIICDGHAMLIDAGNNNKGTAVQSYLMSQKVELLDYVIGTHPDADHIGGMDVIITKFDCGTIFLTDETKDTNTYRDVLDAIKYKSYKKTTPDVGDTYALGTAEFTIVGPSELNSDSNDNSIAIILRHGDNRFYFEGDAGETEEAAICNTGIDITADIYKIGHHGSKTSTSDEILEIVNPDYAVISVGDNQYGHPNAEVMNKLRAKGIKVFRTDEQGTIVASSDGNKITWNMQPDDSWKAGEASGSANSAPLESEQNSIIVHITATGDKYHQAGCQYLRKSDYEVTLEEAKGLIPCSKCKPPQ